MASHKGNQAERVKSCKKLGPGLEGSSFCPLDQFPTCQ